MWFEPTHLLSVDEFSHGINMKLAVPTELHKYWISQNLLDNICCEISALYDQPFQIEIVVTGEKPDIEDYKLPDPPSDLFEAAQSHRFNNPSKTNSFETAKKVFDSDSRIEGLSPDYKFSSFVVGRNNEFAYAASFSIAETQEWKTTTSLFVDQLVWENPPFACSQ